MCCCTKDEDKAGDENEREMTSEDESKAEAKDRSSEAVEQLLNSKSTPAPWMASGKILSFCRPKEEVCVNRDQGKATVEPGRTLFDRAFRDSCADAGTCPATGASSGFTRPVVPAIVNIESQRRCADMAAGPFSEPWPSARPACKMRAAPLGAVTACLPVDSADLTITALCPRQDIARGLGFQTEKKKASHTETKEAHVL